jgi:hypothetical protein
LAILDAIAKLNGPANRPKLSARVGIDSGTVVVGAGAGKDADIFGDTPNIAAGVQAAAEPGSLLITDAVQRLVSGLFVIEEGRAHTLKGIERPVQLYRVIRPTGVRGHLHAAAAARTLTPFVGREDELRLLLSRWGRVRQGDGQAVMLVGEPGIGKSRLVHHFRYAIAGEQHVWLESAGDQLVQNTPFYAVAGMLPQWIGARANDSGGRLLESLLRSLEAAGLNAKQAVPLIAPQILSRRRANIPQRVRAKVLDSLRMRVFGEPDRKSRTDSASSSCAASLTCF